MAEARRPSWREQAALVALLASALASLATLRRTPAAWLALLPAAASLAWRIERLPPRLRTAAEYAAWSLTAATGLLGLVWTLYPVFSEAAMMRLSLAAGLALAILAGVFLLGSNVWAPGRTFLPSVLGAWVAATLVPDAPRGPVTTLAVAGAAAGAWLVFEGRTIARPGTPARVWRVAVFGAAVAALATGISLLLPWAQPNVEQATARLLNPSGRRYAGLSDTSRLGDIEEVALSERVVLRLFSTRPQKLRARVFTQFDGKAWHAAPVPEVTLSAAPLDPAVDAGLSRWLDAIPGVAYLAPGARIEDAAHPASVRSRLVQVFFNNGALVAPEGPLLVRLDGGPLRMSDAGVLTPPPSGPVELYGIVNRPGSRPGALPGNEALAVAPGADPRLVALASRLSEGATPEQRVERTLAYLEECCTYSLKVGAFRTAQPVAEFLFEKRRGYCEYFASAAVVLLRLEGVPVRYVTGFNVTDANHEGGHFVVRESDAHAWIDAWIEGRGWAELDPTPPAQYEAVHAGRPGWIPAALEWLRGFLAELAARIRAGDWRTAFVWLWVEGRGPLALLAGLAGLFVLARRLRWHRRPGRRRAGPAEAPALAPGVLALMRRVEDAWARAGVPRPDARAPLEHLASVPPGRIPAGLREASRRIVDCYYRARFGGRVIPPSELAELGRLVGGAAMRS